MSRRQENTVRIIGGRWRGSKVKFAGTDGLRPTGDRIRETLFNWLSPVIDGASCLDAYAGSGVLGLEALSRGAAAVTFVDLSREATAVLTGEYTRLCGGPAPLGSVVCTEAKRYLATTNLTFDIILLDPPFEGGHLADAAGVIDRRALLNAGGLVYVESGRSLAEAGLPDTWEILREKRAGAVRYGLCAPRADA